LGLNTKNIKNILNDYKNSIKLLKYKPLYWLSNCLFITFCYWLNHYSWNMFIWLFIALLCSH